jgi:hypothetical protein
MTLGMTRDFPTNPPTFSTYDAWVANGSIGNPPNSPYVKEKITAAATISGQPGNLAVSFSSYHVDHGSYGQGDYNNFSITSQQAAANQWISNLHFDFTGPVASAVGANSTSTINSTTEDVSTSGTVSRNNAVVAAFDYYVDPLRGAVQGPGHGWFDWVLWTVNTSVTGAVCGIATAVATGATIVVGTVTIGTGVPAGVVGIGVTAGACATATTFVGNSLWPG